MPASGAEEQRRAAREARLARNQRRVSSHPAEAAVQGQGPESRVDVDIAGLLAALAADSRDSATKPTVSRAQTQRPQSRVVPKRRLIPIPEQQVAPTIPRVPVPRLPGFHDEAEAPSSAVRTEFDTEIERARGESGPSTVQPLRVVDKTHVLERRLPENLLRAGYEVDQRFRSGANLNPVMRVTTPDGALVYLKVESEGRHAHRAEMLASRVLARLPWQGLGRRVEESEDGSVLVIPPVGGDGIRDLGCFADCFPGVRESSETLDSPRAFALARVGLRDLHLQDETDVLRFLLLNAAWANSDRHSANLHFGWRDDPNAPMGGYGVLLPVDHGRCFLNSSPGMRIGDRADSPIDVITGRGGGNPHQLLRPLAELVTARGLTAIEEALGAWCSHLVNVIDSLQEGAEGSQFEIELQFMRARVLEIASSGAEFLKECVGIVR